jgi:hypothetical protein
MQTGYLRYPLEAAMTKMLGFPSSHPATLLLIQTAQQQIQLPMIGTLMMFALLTVRTIALVNRYLCGHRLISLPWSQRQLKLKHHFTK